MHRIRSFVATGITIALLAAFIYFPRVIPANAGTIGSSLITRVNALEATVGTVADGAVTTAKIAASAVTTAKIADLAITTGKLADISVTTGKLVDASVNTAKLVDANVTAGKLADGAATNAKIGASAVGWSKLYMFRSTQQTGTGGAQSIAHGLAITPQWCQVIPEDTTAVGIVAAGYAVSYGSHSSTNCVITATSGLKYTVIAVAP